MKKNLKNSFTLSTLVYLMGLAFHSTNAFSAPVSVSTSSNSFVLETSAMDLSANACTDFYQFANGNWLKHNPIPADRARYSAYDEITERNLNDLRLIAEAAVKEQGQSRAAQLVGAYYQSGINQEKIDADGAAPLADQLREIDQIDNRNTLLTVIGAMHKTGTASLFNFYVDQDAKNTLRYLPQLAQGGLGLPDRDYYLKSDAKTRLIRDKYEAYVAQLFTLLGETTPQAKSHARQVLQFETRLAKASLTKVALRDPQVSYHLMNMGKLNQLSQQDWSAYFQSIGLTDTTQLNIAHPKFMSEVGRMMKTEPISTWKTYLRWQLANSRAKDLSSAFVNANFEFYGRTLAGTKELQPRWKRVLTVIDANIGEALGELYVEKFFTPKAKAGVLEMVDNIKLAMRDSISKLEWMSDKTKQEAYKKLDTLLVKIGYPDQTRDYSTLKLDSNAFALNNMRAAEFEFQRNLNKLGKPIDRNEWGMTAPTVNAYYNPTMNEMVFPAGILQPPLYHLDADLAANYGNTGATIGHELTHAFDDEGRQFDAQGNLKSWWTKEDEQKFLKRVSAIEKQFDEFNPIDNLHINGKLTAGENIADLGGLKIALQAMQIALKKTPQAEKIDGFTPEQRFFIANAQSFRGLTRDERLRLQLATDPHAPEKYRVIAPLANMPEFARAFQCPAEHSPLREISKRVDIW